MIAFSKFVELHEEMSSCLSEIEQHIKSVLGYDSNSKEGVLVDFGVYNSKVFTIIFKDLSSGCNLKALVGEKDYPTMMQITSKDELLSFLKDRQFYI
jgi:hypothetical protein